MEVYVLVGVIIALICIWSYIPVAKFTGNVNTDSPMILTTWWAPATARPGWTTYTFGQPEVVSGISSCTLRLRRVDGPFGRPFGLFNTPETALFVGRGIEHENMLLVVRRGNPSPNPPCTRGISSPNPPPNYINDSMSKLHNIHDTVGLLGIPSTAGGKGSIYCCASIPKDDFIDHLLVGRDDGIWIALASTNFITGQTQYAWRKLLDAPADHIPVQFTVSGGVSKDSTSDDLKSLPRIWSSFFIDPKCINMVENNGLAYPLVQSAALSATISVDGNKLHGDSGHFSAVSPGIASTTLPTQFTQLYHTLDISLMRVSEAQPTALGVLGAVVESNPTGGLLSEVAKKWSPEGRSKQSNRPGFPKVKEAFNYVEGRKAVSQAYIEESRWMKAQVTIKAPSYIILCSSVSPFNTSNVPIETIKLCLGRSLNHKMGAPEVSFILITSGGKGSIRVDQEHISYNTSITNVMRLTRPAPRTIELAKRTYDCTGFDLDGVIIWGIASP